ncbi:MAG: type II secretory ATPase GspE/PulE/Tfp pilus assembly ATPase PilB-like protein [Oleiphilaceae bacterium]|jgi:type II secretory ATPase GspE/PulE/Tfp pilus assembly ATPase PilB-like protein
MENIMISADNKLRIDAKKHKIKFLENHTKILHPKVHNDKALIAKLKTKDMLLLETGVLLTPDVSNTRVLINMKNLCEEVCNKVTIVAATRDDIEALQTKNNEADSSRKNNVAVSDAKMSGKIESYLTFGANMNASDLHLEIRETETRFKLRILGKIVQFYDKTMTHSDGEALSSVIMKVNANVGFNLKEMSSGSFHIVLKGKVNRMRVNYQPVVGGGDLVLRYLSSESDGKISTLDKLGFTPLHQNILTSAMRANRGLILVTGITGSGKTTTLASLLDMIPSDEKTYTIEDPVEKLNPNLSQINIKSDEKATSSSNEEKFKEALKNLLRQDLDNGMIGEIRDKETADQVIDMTLTGHKALGTLHTAGAILALTRLNDMGVSWARLSENGLLKVIVFQKLAPLLCKECKVPIEKITNDHPYVKDPKLTQIKWMFDQGMHKKFKEWKDKGIEHKVFVRNPKGCKQCMNGETSRTVLAEVIKFNRPILEYVREGNMNSLHEYLKTLGWEDIRDHALDLVRAGKIDPYESDKLVDGFFSEDEDEEFSYEKLREDLAEMPPITKIKQVG